MRPEIVRNFIFRLDPLSLFELRKFIRFGGMNKLGVKERTMKHFSAVYSDKWSAGLKRYAMRLKSEALPERSIGKNAKIVGYGKPSNNRLVGRVNTLTRS
jgi:hypothetical protein